MSDECGLLDREAMMQKLKTKDGKVRECHATMPSLMSCIMLWISLFIIIASK